MEDVGSVENVVNDEESEDQNKDDAADDPHTVSSELRVLVPTTRTTRTRWG